MDEQWIAAFRLLPTYLAWHVLLSLTSLTMGITIGISLAVVAKTRPRLRWIFLTLSGLIQTIPGIALLALCYPLLLSISGVTKPLFGISIPALGFLPSLLALSLYAILPILRNGVTSLTGIDPAILEAADSLGMTRWQKLTIIEAPIAMPVAMAGIRTAAVWTIGAATLSTAVGQTSLGNYIFSGLQTENWKLVLFGCGASAAIAIAADQILGLMEIGFTRRDRKRTVLGFAVLIIGLALTQTPLLVGTATSYVIGAKNFSEQFILAELISQRLAGSGFSSTIKEGLGSAVIFRALSSNDIDVYVDYSGTLWTNVLGRTDTVSRDVMLLELTKSLGEKYGVKVLGTLGFENAYALTMTQQRADSLGIRTLDDLAGQARHLALGADLEFLSRPEWTALRRSYGLLFEREKMYTPTFMYRALESGEVDVISAFSSDGRIAADQLTVLADTKGAVPAYDAVVLISPARAGDARFILSLQKLLGKINPETMRAMNLSVDRDTNKLSPFEAARNLTNEIAKH